MGDVGGLGRPGRNGAGPRDHQQAQRVGQAAARGAGAILQQPLQHRAFVGIQRPVDEMHEFGVKISHDRNLPPDHGQQFFQAKR